MTMTTPDTDNDTAPKLRDTCSVQPAETVAMVSDGEGNWTASDALTTAPDSDTDRLPATLPNNCIKCGVYHPMVTPCELSPVAKALAHANGLQHTRSADELKRVERELVALANEVLRLRTALNDVVSRHAEKEDAP